LPKPTTCRFGQLGALAKSFLGRFGKPHSPHLGSYEVKPPNPDGYSFVALHVTPRSRYDAPSSEGFYRTLLRGARTISGCVRAPTAAPKCN
jgi:hypothetical protein